MRINYVTPPPLCIFWKSILVNTPDSYNQLVRSALRAWTVFRLTCSLHGVHCSLLHEQMKSIEVYFTSELSFMDLHCATYSRTDECDIIYLCKYIQFKFTSRTLQCTLNGCTLYKFASNWNHVGISCDVHFAGHLRSNRTNFWSNKSNIRNVQSGGGGAGARELELRTADLVRRTKISLLKNQGHTAHRDSRLACSLSLDLWLFAFDCAKKCSQP